MAKTLANIQKALIDQITEGQRDTHELFEALCPDQDTNMINKLIVVETMYDRDCKLTMPFSHRFNYDSINVSFVRDNFPREEPILMKKTRYAFKTTDEVNETEINHLGKLLGINVLLVEIKETACDDDL